MHDPYLFYQWSDDYDLVNPDEEHYAKVRYHRDLTADIWQGKPCSDWPVDVRAKWYTRDPVPDNLSGSWPFDALYFDTPLVSERFSTWLRDRLGNIIEFYPIRLQTRNRVDSQTVYLINPLQHLDAIDWSDPRTRESLNEVTLADAPEVFTAFDSSGSYPRSALVVRKPFRDAVHQAGFSGTCFMGWRHLGMVAHRLKRGKKHRGSEQ